MTHGNKFREFLQLACGAEDLAETGVPASDRHVLLPLPTEADDDYIDPDIMAPICDIMFSHRYNAPRPRSRSDNNRVGHQTMNKLT